MLSNYFKIALRNLRRNRVFSAINIFGLAIGLAACLLIAAYVRDETHYDRFALRSRDIYRVNLGVSSVTQSDYPMVDVAVGPGMAAAYPEIEASTRLTRAGEIFAQYGTRQFKEQKMAFVDSNLFELFTLPFHEGDVHTALTQPNSLVVTRAFAAKYFGNEPALGKTLELQNYGACKITGVIDKIPDESHFHMDAFLSFSTLKFKQYTWSNIGFYTYLLLRPHTDPQKLQTHFPELVAKYAVPEIARDMGVPLAEAKKAVNSFVFSLTPLQSIHLHSDTKYDLEANGNSRYVLVFSALAIFILLLACANFSNLSTAGTAGAAGRSREIGIRKVLGASITSVLILVSKEFLILVGFAFLIAIPLTWWGMQQWLQEFAYRTTLAWWIFPLAGLAALILAMLTISFQAVRTARANPVNAMHNE